MHGRGDVASLVARVGEARRRFADALADLQTAAPPRGAVEPEDAALSLGRTQGGALVHVLGELTQHLGQLEVTRDVLRVHGAGPR